MARLPSPGSDDGTWGDILNEYLEISHTSTGTLKNLPLNAKDYGAVGDGATNDTTALQSFLTAVSSTGTPGIIPKGVYQVHTILNVGDNSVISMYNATLSCYDTDLGSGGYGNDVPVLSINNVANVLIMGGKIDGRKASFGSTEFKAGVSIYSGTNITLRDMTAINCKGDGFHISLDESADPASENVVMKRCIADGNHRQGMSIISLINGRFSDCNFINTDGTNPQSGVDIEPNLIGESVIDLYFDRCTFDGNTGSGFVASLVNGSTVQHGITVSNSTVKNNDQWGVWLANIHDVTFHRTLIQGNGTQGIWVLSGTNSELSIENCTIQSNGDNGRSIFDNEAGSTIVDLKILNCRIGANSTRAADSFRAISLGGDTLAATMTDVLIANNTLGKSGATTQLIGIFFGEDTTFVTTRINDNHLTNENSLPIYPVSPPTGITARGNIGMTDV